MFLLRLSVFVFCCIHLNFKVLANDLITVPYVDLSRYAGTWYQIARNPHLFETGCVCSRQVLTPIDANTISVYNTCNEESPDGPLSEIRGTARNDNPNSNSKFTVDFNLPFKGKYWIIGLDSDYQYAVVSSPDKNTLYILSKTPTLESSLYIDAINSVSKQIDVSKLSKTQQEECRYPTESNI